MTVKEDLEKRIKEFAEQNTLVGDALAQVCLATMIRMPADTLEKEIEDD